MGHEGSIEVKLRKADRLDIAREETFEVVMKLTGDPEGIAVLKALHQQDKEYLKFLVGEAKSNTDLKATFKSKEGKKYVLRLDLATGDLEVMPG